MTFQVNDKPGELINSMKPTAYTEGNSGLDARLMSANDIITFYIIDKNGNQWCIAQSEIQYLRP